MTQQPSFLPVGLMQPSFFARTISLKKETKGKKNANMGNFYCRDTLAQDVQDNCDITLDIYFFLSKVVEFYWTCGVCMHSVI